MIVQVLLSDISNALKYVKTVDYKWKLYKKHYPDQVQQIHH